MAKFARFPVPLWLKYWLLISGIIVSAHLSTPAYIRSQTHMQMHGSTHVHTHPHAALCNAPINTHTHTRISSTNCVQSNASPSTQVLYDAGYILLRPHTMEGGSLAPFWAPYHYYQTVDLVYSNSRYQS